MINRRRFLELSALSVPAAGLAGYPLSAFAAGALERIKQTGVVRVGCSSQEPTSMVTPDGFTGESLEAAQVVLRGMGIQKLEPVVMQFGALIPALQAGRIDMIAQGLSITPPRCEQIVFSDPYYAKLTNLLVMKGNPHGVKNFNDIAKKPDVRFAYTLGGTEGPQAKSAGVTEAQTSTYPTSPALIDALKAGRVDAIAIPDLMVNWRLAKKGWEAELFETPGSFLPKMNGKDNLTCVAFGFRKDDMDFRDAFNKVLGEKKVSGELKAVVKKFGVTDEGFELAQKLTAEQLCKPSV
jgi:polar amino acid transport system substrate-binding protein